jgi:hypothetical protein
MEVSGYRHDWQVCFLVKSLRYLLNGRFDGTYNSSVHFGEEKLIFLAGMEPRIAQLVRWTLYELLTPVFHWIVQYLECTTSSFLLEGIVLNIFASKIFVS